MNSDTAMRCEERLEQYLQQHRVHYQVQHHPLAFTAQQVASAEHVPGHLVAKVVAAFADERPVMLVVPASHRKTMSVAYRDFERLEAPTTAHFAHPL